MAQQLNGEIENIVQGDNIDITRTIDQLPASITKAWLTVKANRSSTADTNAIFQKTITSINVPGVGVIVDDGTGDGIAEVRFELVNADTVLLTNETAYYYDIQVLTSTDKIYTPEIGIIKLRSERTKSTS
jgi:hypothetical protein